MNDGAATPAPWTFRELIISKGSFRPGWMAPSEWMWSNRAVTDTLLADNSVTSVNIMCRIANRTLIAVSPFLLALSVTYLKRTLSHCGQLWAYIVMGSLGMCLHRYRNAMGDAAEMSPRAASICMQNSIFSVLIIHIIWSRQIYVAIENALLIRSSWSGISSSCLWNYVCEADDVSHAENLQSNGYW